MNKKKNTHWDSFTCKKCKLSGKFGELINATLDEWYLAKHPDLTNLEVKLNNALEIKICPYCNSVHIVKNGKNNNGVQRYKCLDCNKRFLPLTGTIFDSHKIPISECIEFVIHLFEFHSLNLSSRDNRNAESTGRYWLPKIFEALKGYQDNIRLSGDIYIDEMYLPCIKSKVIKKNGKKLRGISKNKYCIATATDGKRVIFIYEGKDKPSINKTIKAYASHIEEGSHIISDSEKSYSALIEKLNLTQTNIYSKI